MSADNHLFDDFPPVSRKEWEEVIQKDLDGADYKTRLKWNTGEGIQALPFYRGDDLQQTDREAAVSKQHANDAANSWEIREAIFDDTIEAASQSAQDALQSGAGALQFHLHTYPTEGAIGGDLAGLAIQQQQDFFRLLEDIDVEQRPLHFDAGMASPALLAMLWNEVQKQNIKPQNIEATFLYDPFIFILQNGYLPKSNGELQTGIGRLADFCNQKLPNVRPLGIKARLYHNSGATMVQELACALGTASEYFAILTEQGFDANEIAGQLHFSFSIGSSYFLEIAKFRAARILWENLLDAYGADPGSNSAYLHGQTSEWNKTLYEPYTNMLRSSTESMSAAIGGCDALTVLPFDQHIQQPDEFSQRIARNQQILLSEEAYFDKVTDPSAGSYYIETLTDKLGQEAWKLFKEIEGEGGLLESIKEGTVQTAIEKSRQQRDRNIAMRNRVFVGTNKYAKADADKPANEMLRNTTVSLLESDNEYTINHKNLIPSLAKAFAEEATMGDLISALITRNKHRFSTISPYRGPQAFETLRQRTEQHAETPRVLTLPMGDKKMRKARSTFTVNFFGCIGYDITDPIGFDTMQDALEKIRESQPDIVALCSSDEEYTQLVPDLCKALSQLDDRPITVLAGYPKNQVEQFRKAGIDYFIHTKSNALESLKTFQKQLGIIEKQEL